MAQVTEGYRVHGEVLKAEPSGIVLVLKQGDTLAVHPDKVHILKETGTVRWWFLHEVVPPGGRVEIEFDGTGNDKGPFKARSADPANPERGKYVKNHKPLLDITADLLDKNPETPTRYWKYSVRVYDCPKGGDPIRTIDPGVAIDDGG
jgi:hypothetical protein